MKITILVNLKKGYMFSEVVTLIVACLMVGYETRSLVLDFWKLCKVLLECI